MRKIFTTLFVLVLTASGLFAQDSFHTVFLPEVPAAAPVKKIEKKAATYSHDLYVGLSLMPGIRLGGFKDSVKTGLDILVDGELFLNEKLSVGIQTGFMYFPTDPVNCGDGKQTFIPLTFKATYFFLEQPFRPYGGLTAGYFLSKKEYTFMSAPYFDPVVGETIPGKETPVSADLNCPGVSPMIGFYYDIDDKFAANFGAQFFFLFPEGGASNSFGIKFGAVYKLGI
jgi:hypothetical protein